MKDFTQTHQEWFKIMSLDGEEWRDVQEFKGYKVSNYGRVVSVKRFSPVLLQTGCCRNQEFVTFCENGRSKSRSVKKLVRETFGPQNAGTCPECSAD